jgi:RecB family exonuclease
LSSGPVLDPVDSRPVPATRWDTVSREAGVVAGGVQWHDRLSRHRAELDRELAIARADGGGRAAHVRRREGDLDAVERLDAFVADLATRVVPPAESTWTAHTQWALGLLEHYLGGEGRRADWPEAELDAGRRVETTLAGLAALDELGTAVDVARFRRALQHELDTAVGTVQRFGTGVFVGPLHHAYGGHFDTIFVLGMVEGAFPPRRRDDPLLPERDRDAVPALVARNQRLDDRRDYLAALAGATERVLCAPRADNRAQRSRLPARWLLETAEVLESRSLSAQHLHGHRAPWLEVVVSFEDGLVHDHDSGSAIEHDLRSLLAWRSAHRSLAGHPLVTGPLADGVEALTARASDALTSFDGGVGAHPRLALSAERPVSPSALQDWAACPFRYFLGRVLRVREVPKPEAIQAISPVDEGTLVHAILEAFVARVRARRSPDDGWDAEDRALLEEIVEEQCTDAERRGVTGRPLQWQLARRRIRQTVERFLVTDDLVRSALGVVPATDGLELVFGSADVPVEVSVDLAAGGSRSVAFRGRIDRVDRSPDGRRAVVYDYKTGWPRRLHDDPVAAGQALQLPVYALAARSRFGAEEVASYYWYTRNDGRAALVGFDVDDACRERFVEVVGHEVEGIEAGCFPAYPGEPAWDYRTRHDSFDNCAYCAYDRLCAPDRLSAWNRKENDPSLAPFLALDLPDDAGDGGE